MKTIITTCLLLVGLSALAQKRLTLEETVPGSTEYYAHANIPLRGYFNQSTDEFISAESAEYANARSAVVDVMYSSGKSDASPAIVSFVSDNLVWVRSYAIGNDYLVDIKSGNITDSLLQTAATVVDVNEQHSAAAISEEGNLYVSTSRGVERVNEVESIDGVVYGTSVHRDEFGISKGTYWSHNGAKLAFYRMDESMVGQYPIVDITARESVVKPIRYPMAGETSHEVSVGVYDVVTAKAIYLKTVSPVDRYFTNIAWSGDDKYIVVAEINRDQDHMWFNVYDAATGEKVKTLFEEENNEWVEPCVPAMFIDATHFAWISERDGYKHIYLYNLSDGSYRQLTTGKWCVTDLYGYNASTKEIVFQGNREGYLTKDIYKVTLKGKVARLSDMWGVSNGRLSPNAKYVLNNCSSARCAMTSSLVDVASGKSTQLKQVRDRYAGYDMPQIDTVSLKSADGKFDLTGTIILPTDFDASKKYPVIVYLYGGPHAHLVDAGYLYGASTWKLYFAQQGYIIFSMDNRGSEARGVEYEHAVHRRLGQCEMADQMQGIEYLRSLPYVDQERIGIHGWSFGGFMTINMMENHNDVFRCGVAGGPVCDWSLYEVMYGERYMDRPEQNPEGYDLCNVSKRTCNIRGRLLVIHGDIDPVVVWQNSLRLLRDAVESDVLIDYAVYPRHEHNVIGKDRVHLFKKILQYFDDHLK